MTNYYNYIPANSLWSFFGMVTTWPLNKLSWPSSKGSKGHGLNHLGDFGELPDAKPPCKWWLWGFGDNNLPLLYFGLRERHWLVKTKTYNSWWKLQNFDYSKVGHFHAKRAETLSTYRKTTPNNFHGEHKKDISQQMKNKQSARSLGQTVWHHKLSHI